MYEISLEGVLTEDVTEWWRVRRRGQWHFGSKVTGVGMSLPFVSELEIKLRTVFAYPNLIELIPNYELAYNSEFSCLLLFPPSVTGSAPDYTP